ncbi:hypothetical protein Godav_012952 [Gossypium davidsonii]|uniref:Uncharacterized protein n=1 Tax=Gossypium davidsonii TaxID=34287 RepID=A0A7J8RF35_GOSDV|nr:hypothetical protein [Gossypium davidsonii]
MALISSALLIVRRYWFCQSTLPSKDKITSTYVFVKIT